MKTPEALRNALCKTFCSSVSVNAVPSGYAISTVFTDRSGDLIGFYLANDGEGYRIEDDGEYLARLIGMGIPIDQGNRGQLLDAILEQAQASWDRDTFEIRTTHIAEPELGKRITEFISALIRVRDLELLTRDIVRSTFREDAIAALEKRYSEVATFNENEAIDRNFREFPSDLVIRPKMPAKALAGAIYFVTSNDKLNEALLLQYEADKQRRNDFRIIALLEEPNMKLISHRRFQRAQNRSLPMPIFRGDEDAAIEMVGRSLALLAA